ncbi:NADP-dependent oxidoreductase [Micromonospora sp. PLK6-60]|uniref:NADP-dependent oxidoreductase n=1 Tax=Micromonospora sp. PLK6-60 TaxID=2873383 RepID=UPI001CA68700|nr:NADP-dependent oxidoreductase [Micromonospora sp. PLK6-60]MBY8871016.1 NADP-dependent oxidoreductase [Micromonospora sp. PLK6-60]
MNPQPAGHPAESAPGPDLMRAVVIERFGDPQVLRTVRLPRPARAPGHALVRVRAASVNFGETKIRKGLVPELGPPPLGLGSDLSGTVVEAEPGGRFRAGDDVYGIHFIGTYAEYVSVPEAALAAKPGSVDHVTAAALPVAAQTALVAVADYADLRAGQRILIHAAAGGVGHLAAQLARHRGAHVLGTARTAHHPFLRELGVHEPIDYTRVDFRSAATDIDVVLDLVGGEYGRRSLDCLRPGGLLLGAALDPGVTEEDAARRGRRYRWVGGTRLARPLDLVRELVDAGHLRVHVERTYPLSDLPAAHAHADSGRVTGKLVIAIDDEPPTPP